MDLGALFPQFLERVASGPSGDVRETHQLSDRGERAVLDGVLMRSCTSAFAGCAGLTGG